MFVSNKITNKTRWGKNAKEMEISNLSNKEVKETVIRMSIDFPGGSDNKASVYNVGDVGSIPESGSSLEKEMATHSSTFA